MAISVPFVSPRIVGLPGVDSPTPRAFSLAQNAALREGDFAVLSAVPATGAAGKFPFPQGALAAVAGPLPANYTVTTPAQAGAPAQTYYIVLAYTATGSESLASAEFLVNCAAGTTPQINVASAGSPAGSTNFAVFAGIYSGGETLQQASITTTALGANFQIAATLINPVGVVRAATNATTNIVGIMCNDSQALWATGVGGSQTGGNIGNLLGTWPNPPPLSNLDPSQVLVDSLLGSAPIEISLRTPWANGLVGAAFGIALDTSQQTAGIFVADVTATACGVILGPVQGVESDVGGGTGDTGTRVRAFLNASAVI